MNRSVSIGFGLFAMSLTMLAFGEHPAQAQTAADVQASVSKACAVMSGNQKPDGQFIQIMNMMVDNDMADTNPISLGVQRGALSQCPKSYLAFKQREHASNPFAAHPLYRGGVSLLGSSTSSLAPAAPARPQDYAFYCHGGSPMASRSGATLIVTFDDPGHPANSGLRPGQCAWWTRNLRPGEPNTIKVKLDTARHATIGVRDLDAGGDWTFWVYNVGGRYFHTTRVAKGYLQNKP